ncbi:hypothetical protein [Methylomonas albis]|nr:hypothetical protein [Methylomonas albis]
MQFALIHSPKLAQDAAAFTLGIRSMPTQQQNVPKRTKTAANQRLAAA